MLNEQGGVISRRQHPDLAVALAWLVRRRELVSVLPGVYALPQIARSFETRMRAAQLWDPDAVLVGDSAARMSFWPQLLCHSVELASRQHTIVRPGYALVRRKIHPDLIMEPQGWRMTTPAMTALDLCEDHGGNGIDIALRTRTATLEGMREALDRSGHRPGNRLRRSMLLDSRDEPWSEAERRAHTLLRQARITGWVSNFAVRSAGHLYFVDIAFEELKLALEIDGRTHEDDFHQFESDRWRQNALVLEGWTVLRFTWPMLRDHPLQVIRTVREALGPQNLTPIGRHGRAPGTERGPHRSSV